MLTACREASSFPLRTPQLPLTNPPDPAAMKLLKWDNQPPHQPLGLSGVCIGVFGDWCEVGSVSSTCAALGLWQAAGKEMRTAEKQMEAAGKRGGPFS